MAVPIAMTQEQQEQQAQQASLRDWAKRAGGTTQILLNPVAERVLGLPR
jgi:hypothetical protein